MPALKMTAELERPDQSVELLSAALSHDGRAVLRARAGQIVGGDTSALASGGNEPQVCAPMAILDDWRCGYLAAYPAGWTSRSGSCSTRRR
ncbi:hypothetical protein [Actinosynnema sp. NPDC023587]|uniref:hypothetical protein n=1 Tax=Actinosynnema sp. NPDC023587 TaxID=3154695 RepID=UPI0033EF10DB